MTRGKELSATTALSGLRRTVDLPYSAKSLAAAIAALNEHFMLTVNVVVERHTFRKRV